MLTAVAFHLAKWIHWFFIRKIDMYCSFLCERKEKKNNIATVILIIYKQKVFVLRFWDANELLFLLFIAFFGERVISAIEFILQLWRLLNFSSTFPFDSPSFPPLSPICFVAGVAWTAIIILRFRQASFCTPHFSYFLSLRSFAHSKDCFWEREWKNS